jgi:integrase
VPTLDQVLHVIRNMPTGSEIELRNRALIAFTLLTGARDRALASLKLKHINIAEDHVRQDAREAHTKFAKTFTTSLMTRLWSPCRSRATPSRTTNRQTRLSSSRSASRLEMIPAPP